MSPGDSLERDGFTNGSSVREREGVREWKGDASCFNFLLVSGLRCEEQGVFQSTAHEARGPLIIMRGGPGVLSDRPMGGLTAGGALKGARGRRSLSRFARCTTNSD